MNQENQPWLSPETYRQVSRSSVEAILGASTPPVDVQGDQFFNVDRWTLRAFVMYMLAWAKTNQGTPTQEDLQTWVDRANAERVDPRIVLADVSQTLSEPVLYALIGGAYHEAWHTLYSCHRDITVGDVSGVLARWDLVPSWVDLEWVLQQWINVVEDIRIERLGQGAFPGSGSKMPYLHDCILQQEVQIRQERAQAGRTPATPLTVVMMMFRDLGLGYATQEQDRALSTYRGLNTHACALVEHGALQGVLGRAHACDDTGCLPLAMDIVGIIHTLAVPEDKVAAQGVEITLHLLEGLPPLEGVVKQPKAAPSGAVHVDKGKPWAPAPDTVTYVAPSDQGQTKDTHRAQTLLESVRQESAYLYQQMHKLFKAPVHVETLHGTRSGSRLSERRFVEGFIDLKGGTPPSRPYQRDTLQEGLSLAAAVLIDQSGSMGFSGQGLNRRMKLEGAAKCMLAIVDPLEALGCATLAAGFREGVPKREDVHIDIFKGFAERLAPVSWRFANTRAWGGTPMADGVQFGLTHLRCRPERHRFLFVITDGRPNSGHAQAIQMQVQLAQAQGIVILGVGIGMSAKYVQDVFPDHVWAHRVDALPPLLVAKILTLLHGI